MRIRNEDGEHLVLIFRISPRYGWYSAVRSAIVFVRIKELPERVHKAILCTLSELQPEKYAQTGSVHVFKAV